MALHFDYASAAAPTSSKRPAPTATRGSSYTAPLALRFLYSFEAREQINAKIDEIMAIYPPGKKNKMFTLRYGSPESIKQMNIKAIFTHLNIVKPKKFALIESLDYSGNHTLSK